MKTGINTKTATRPMESSQATDFHSFSNPQHVRIRHLNLKLDVSFAEQTLRGIATLIIERIDLTQPLILDTKHLEILRVESSVNGLAYSPTSFSLGPDDPILGSALEIQLPQAVQCVRVEYSTTSDSLGVQWLAPAQTSGKKYGFMFTQSQTIHARTWIPLQDTPQVRFTFQASVNTPPNLLAVMSAGNNPQVSGVGKYEFEMPQPIPSYLIALAVGELAFQSLGPRTGLYAEPSVLQGAATELGDVERMVKATEKLYGPYLWERYDMLVLPPSFPLGGMENPRLTFVTPTILAGDKSLVSLIAHELAHSWSGNLVTNATWSDFWLNEGFTTYVERRVVEEVYGKKREEMEAALGYEHLKDELATLEDSQEILHIDLKGKDPEECVTRVPYEKGVLFLRQIEETFGRERFDQFLRDYFSHFAFQSITTADFVAYLQQELLECDPERARKLPLSEWLYEPGLPASAPHPSSEAFFQVEEQADRWLRGVIPAPRLPADQWTTHEWLHFLRYLPKDLNQDQLKQLDDAFQLTKSGNAEIVHDWLLMTIRSGYEAANWRLSKFLQSIGREKLIKPLYEELIKSSSGWQRALEIYRLARPTYHLQVVNKIDRILNFPKPGDL